MVYGIFGGEYSDWYVLGYFTDYEDAEKYCAAFGEEDYYVKELENLNGKEDLSKVKVVYRYEVAFYQSRYKNNTWEMCNNPHYTCYEQSVCEPNSVESNFQKVWVKFRINIDKCDEKLAEKIAQDYFAELLAYGDGEVREENIKLMNEKFARRQRE